MPAVVTRDGTITLASVQGNVWLSAREWQLLDYLGLHAGRFVTWEELGAAVFGGGRSTDAAVRQVVKRIRTKLGADHVETVHGLGYRVPSAIASDLTWRCGSCGRATVTYGRQWSCHTCGAAGQFYDPPDQLIRFVGDTVIFDCYDCGARGERRRQEYEYEIQRAAARLDGKRPRLFCSMECTRRWSRRTQG